MLRPFQEWAPGEIKRLRAEADALELILRRYLADEAPEAPKTNGAGHSASAGDSARVRSQGQPRPKNAIMSDFINRSGSTGVKAAEIHRFAQEDPAIGLGTNASRAMLWGLKKQGRVILRDGRYYGKDSENPRPQDPGFPLEH